MTAGEGGGRLTRPRLKTTERTGFPRNSPNLAVALNCGMGSSSLNAEVNALERLQIVRDRNSSYLGSKYKSWTVRARCFGASSLPSTNASYTATFAVTSVSSLFCPGLHLLSHGVEIPLHAVYAHRDAVDERERFRVFREDGREHTRDSVSKPRLH
jgi:hypothetical protein